MAHQATNTTVALIPVVIQMRRILPHRRRDVFGIPIYSVVEATNNNREDGEMWMVESKRAVFCIALALLSQHVASAVAREPQPPSSGNLAALVNPLIGTAAGGNTFPGAVLPFGMLSWSPENTRGQQGRAAAPGGYHYEAMRIRGFSLTHLSGTGCRGASGDIPFMPFTSEIATSPSTDDTSAIYASSFTHADEYATPGSYRVKLESGVDVQLAATLRSGAARFAYPPGTPAAMLVRTSDTQIGSSDAEVLIDGKARTITGSVTSGNFCGYLSPAGRRSYYTLYFAAVFDRPFASTGTWQDAELRPATTTARGGTTYGSEGYPPPAKGSGGYVTFAPGSTVNVRVGISYVSLENARRNLAAEQSANARSSPSRAMRAQRGTGCSTAYKSREAPARSGASSTRRCITLFST
jgi:putative alpha-1,2-mannosidase